MRVETHISICQREETHGGSKQCNQFLTYTDLNFSNCPPLMTVESVFGLDNQQIYKCFTLYDMALPIIGQRDLAASVSN